MVQGYHVILCTYGFWLPNDPRGSYSIFVGSKDLLPFGKATKTNTRHSVAHESHDAVSRTNAKAALHYPPVSLTGLQARAVGRGFAHVIAQYEWPVWACAILPEHVHLVLGRLDTTIESAVAMLKRAATRKIKEEGLFPPSGAAEHEDTPTELRPLWARGAWKVFLNSGNAIDRAIAYVENNPIKEGKPRQHWPFVTQYEERCS